MENNCEKKVRIRTEEEKKAIITRINRLTGQLEGVKRMVQEDDRHCDELLIQLSAADKAIKSLANFVLDAHLHTCVAESIKQGDESELDGVIDLFKRFQ